MAIPEKLLEVLKKDGVVAIATLGPEGPHMVNTWNTYIRVSEDGRLLIPAGYYHKTQANITVNNKVLVTLGSNQVQGLNGPGTGFLIKGTAAFLTTGQEFDAMKSRFGWARRPGHHDRLCDADTVARMSRPSRRSWLEGASSYLSAFPFRQ